MPKSKHPGPKPNANEAQLRAARHQGSDLCMVICLTVLMDKYGWEGDELAEFIHKIGDLSKSINRGYVNYQDLHHTLAVEQGLEW